MILATVGMHDDGFPRLVRAIDEIASHINEEVVIQVGSTQYTPSTAKWFCFATEAHMNALIVQSRVVVSHAGAGSILRSLQFHKPIIVIPRLSKFGEHVDDHQLELAEELEHAGAVLVAREASDLPKQLEAAATFSPRLSDRGQLIHAVRRAVLLS